MEGLAIDAPRQWYANTPTFVAPTLVDTRGGPVRIPTGVPDFDYLAGGIPAGSTVLLIGEPGAGHQEFALTSAAHLMLHFDDPELHRFYLGNARGPFEYPVGVVYVSLTRAQDQVMREVSGAFDPTYHEVLARHLKFHDISPSYFVDSVVPTSWSSVEQGLLAGLASGTATVRPTASPLAAIADALEADGPGNLVLVDSLTDLLVRRGVDTEEVLTLVKGLRRRSKSWGGLVYLLLTRGVAPPAVEAALIDSVDGVLSFSWATSPMHSSRQRTMLIEKFMSVLSRIPQEHQGRFVIRVSNVSGLVTTQYERV
ncbi:MAG: hypothetical protein L3K15_09560 [Thermoplasmata archaeon]|nr:hypothetical protein [Thermoplasmata archaeon]